MQFASRKAQREFLSYDELYTWSTDNIAGFWQTLWDYFEIIHSRRHDSVLDGKDIRTARWFEGAQLNFAENLLRYRDEHLAIIHQTEFTGPTSITYRDLYKQVARCASGLRDLNIGPGDRVAAFLPNSAFAIIAMLATTSLGAIWSSCSPDFGFQGVLDRFGQIKPKVIFTTDGYQYGGKQYDCLATVRQLASSVSSIEQIVGIPYLPESKLERSDKFMLWEDLLANDSKDIEFAQLPFDHPVYIMYSSGTTGVPKCMVHGAGGTLLQHLKELSLHTDLKRNDVITYYTTCGWMMWNWLVSSLAIGATVYLYDGSPAYPDMNTLYAAVDDCQISVLGTSPGFLSSCENAGLKPKKTHSLTSLRTVLSTGAPLSDSNFQYVYNNIKSDLQLSSISGGTDIISCFMLGNPILPVYSGEIQCRGLGMKVETYDDTGRAVIDTVGELVCTAPFPSRPVMFWNDPDGKKYSAAYFEHFPGVWRHGDYIRINDRGGVIVYGRSDATLNRGGVRIGTAEIYAPVEAMDEIEDSIVVGQQAGSDIRIVLFVVLAQGHELDDNLKNRIKDRIRKMETPRHVPDIIIAVRDIPRTLNGKKVEMAVTRLIHHQKVTNIEALANPESLAEFSDLKELKLPPEGL